MPKYQLRVTVNESSTKNIMGSSQFEARDDEHAREKAAHIMSQKMTVELNRLEPISAELSLIPKVKI